MMDPLRDRALEDPDGPAVAGAGADWSWRELDARTDRAVLHLAGAGVGPGSVVQSLLPPSPDALVLLHALPRLGAVLVPLHPAWTPPELVQALAAANPSPPPGVGLPAFTSFLVLPGERLGPVRAHLEGEGMEDTVFIAVDEDGIGGAEDAGAPFLHRPTDPERTAETLVALVLTSGSTGRPRPIPLTQGNLMASAEGAARRLRLGSTDRWLASLALAHVGGLTLLHRGGVIGSTTVFAGTDRFDAARFLELADAGEITHASLVPVMLQRVLDLAGNRPAPRALRCLLLGGAAAPRPLVERALRSRWPVALTYGLTEATSQVATAPPDEVRRRPEGVGRPLPEVRIRIEGPGGADLPRGAEGEILVAGPTVAPLDFPGGWLRTGDIGRFDDEGCLHVTGRASERIVSGGVTVHPGEVEAALLTHPGVSEAAVVGRPDPEWGERIIAFVVPADAGAPPDEAELVAHGRERLASAKRPREAWIVDALPRTATGKVDRRALSRRLARE